MTRVVVLGAGGMLGHKVLQRLTEGHDAIGTLRGAKDDEPYRRVPFLRSDAVVDRVDAADFGGLAGVLERIRRKKGKGRVFAPVVQSRKGKYLDLLTAAHRAGVELARVDGKMVSTDAPPRLRKTKEHDIDLLFFEGKLSELPRDVLERSLSWARGGVRIVPNRGAEEVLSTNRACPSCG